MEPFKKFTLLDESITTIATNHTIPNMEKKQTQLELKTKFEELWSEENISPLRPELFEAMYKAYNLDRESPLVTASKTTNYQSLYDLLKTHGLTDLVDCELDEIIDCVKSLPPPVTGETIADAVIMHFTGTNVKADIRELFLSGAKFGSKWQSKQVAPVTADVEEAAKEYAKDKMPGYNWPCEEAFIVGAQWQARQMAVTGTAEEIHEKLRNWDWHVSYHESALADTGDSIYEHFITNGNVNLYCYDENFNEEGGLDDLVKIINASTQSTTIERLTKALEAIVNNKTKQYAGKVEIKAIAREALASIKK